MVLVWMSAANPGSDREVFCTEDMDIYGMLFIDLLPFTTIYMNEKIEHSIDFVWMLFSWYLQDLFSHSMSAGGGAGWWQGCGRRRF